MQAEIEILQVEKKIRSRVKKQMEKTQKEYYLNEQMQAIQKELGERDEFKNEIAELEEKIKTKKMSKEASLKVRKELKKLKMMTPDERRGHGGAQLHRLDPLAALVRVHRGQARHRRGREDPRRGPLRPEEGQGAHPRVPGGAGAGREAARGPSSASSGRPAWARPRWPAPSPAPWARNFVRISPRRRARRGRDPRPPPHLHRRAARQDHPVAQEGRQRQPGLPARRGRQDVDRLPRRPVGGAARGARPRAEPHLQRPLPRPRLRPLRRHVHHAPPTPCTASRCRCRTAWRSSGSPATPTWRSCSIAERYLVPKQKEANGLASTELTFRERGAPLPHPPLHQGVGRAHPGARARQRLPQDAPRSVLKKGPPGERGVRGHREAGAEAARPAQVPARRRRGRGPGRPHHRAGLDRAGRRAAHRRGHGHAGQGQADHHRQAGRRHAGVGAGGHELRAHAGPSCSGWRSASSSRSTSTSTCPRAPSPRTARAPASPWPPRWSRRSARSRCGATWP